MNKILVIGSTVCDLVIKLDKLPSREGDAHIDKQTWSIGGCAFNVAHFIHEMGLSYQFISPLGRGVYGDFLKNQLQQLGMAPSHCLDGENGVCYCFVEADGERTFLSYHGVEYSFDPAWIEDIEPSAYLYVCGIELEEKTGADLCRFLEDYEGQIVFAPGPRLKEIPKDRIEKLLKKRPILHLNKEEASEFLKIFDLPSALDRQEEARQIYGLSQNIVVITLGSQGALAYDSNFYTASSYPSSVVDTIGAGDSHMAAFLAAYSQGRGIEKSLDFANQVAAETVSHQGSQLSPQAYQYFKEILNERD